MLSVSDFNCIFSEIMKTSEKLIKQNIAAPPDELKINISTSAISVVKQEPNNT